MNAETTARFTAGPWHIVPPGGPQGPFYGLVNSQGNVVATQIVGEANARLIAGSPELRQTAGELHRLLREWRRTPFFEDSTEWQRWVDDFGARVDQATDVAVTVLRKGTEDRP